MPTIDAGHYFLTTLFPVKSDPVEIYGTVVTTPVLALREALATLPTAYQSEACLSNGNSPFARNTRNHFARFAVIDVPAFNGRVQGDTLLAALRRTNPIVPQQADVLNRAFLFFSADFNCIHGDDIDLDSYLTTLWETMRQEIEAIFKFCIGFETVHSALDFIAYVRRCQLETTMPFHDYWSAEELAQLPKVAKPLLFGAGAGAIIFAAILAAAIIIHKPVWCWILLTVLTGLAVLAGLYAIVMAEGKKPFPAAHGADLPGVLKSLYLQSRFTRFAIDNQGADPAALHAAFAAFIAETQPGHVAAPTQAPGTIGA
jgi:hypothetical protein